MSENKEIENLEETVTSDASPRQKTLSDCMVRLEYRNKDLEIVSSKVCSFVDYIEILRSSIIRSILDAEELVYCATDGKCKNEWPDSVLREFSRLRHRLLDVAGDIERLPQNTQLECHK